MTAEPFTCVHEPPAPSLVATALCALSHVRHGFFGRTGGVSRGAYGGLNCGFGSQDEPERVARNRARAAAALGLPGDALVTLYQIHSPKVVEVTTPWRRTEGPRADAMVTRVPGLALGVLTADCAPVLLADTQAHVVGAVHAGWKGAIAGVTDAAIAAMEELGAVRERIIAVIGPCITQENYEVGPDFRTRFRRQDPAADTLFAPSTRNGHWRFDLPGYVLRRLEAAGLAHAAFTGPCTYARETDYFSYRRATHRHEPDYGRNLSAIALTET